MSFVNIIIPYVYWYSVHISTIIMIYYFIVTRFTMLTYFAIFFSSVSKMWKVNGRRTPSNDKSSHAGELKIDRTNNDLQNITHKNKNIDRVTRTILRIGGELRCSGRVSSSRSTSGARCVTLVTNLVISHEWGKDRKVLMTSGTYPWSFVTHMFHSGGNHKTFEVMTSI